MLSDPKWDEKIEVALDSVEQHILRATDYIEKHGWCRNSLETIDGRVCLQGALMRTDLTTSYSLNLAHHQTLSNAYLAADYRVRTYLGASTTHEWNDSFAGSKEEVIAKLREAAYLGK